MSVSLPNRSIISIAATYGASKAISAISNANPGVATLEASHGIVVADVMEVNSGWSLLSGRIARASVVAANDVTLEGMNVSSTVLFPAGSGVGSVREILTWTQIAQVTDNESSGGDPQYTTYSFLEDPTERQIPTGKSAKSLSLTMADDPSKPWYAIAEAADLDGLPRAIRVQLPSGGVIYYNGFISFNKEPSLKKNEIMQVKLSISIIADTTRYNS